MAAKKSKAAKSNQQTTTNKTSSVTAKCPLDKATTKPRLGDIVNSKLVLSFKNDVYKEVMFRHFVKVKDNMKKDDVAQMAIQSLKQAAVDLYGSVADASQSGGTGSLFKYDSSQRIISPVSDEEALASK